MKTNTLLNNVLQKLLREWNLLNQKEGTEAEMGKEQIMNSIRTIYDEASALLNEEPALLDFCIHTYENILSLDPMEAHIHFTTHINQTHEPANSTMAN